MKTRVLIVDDEIEICEILREVLTAEGFEVLIAHNAAEFCLQALAKSPQLIILDINLGGTSGPEVYNDLLCKGLNNSIPVIFLSALVPEELSSPGRVIPGRKYIMHAKPFYCDRLIQDIKNLTKNLSAEAA